MAAAEKELAAEEVVTSQTVGKGVGKYMVPSVVTSPTCIAFVK
jgi:hypothetical protein